MGVPIFCLEGDSALARCTYSINKNLKMDNWIAKNENEYIKNKTILVTNAKINKEMVEVLNS